MSGIVRCVTSVGFLHVAAAHVSEARRLVAEQAPWLSDVHIVDEALAEAGSSADLAKRIATRVGELIGRDVDMLVCQCPELIAEVRRVAARSGLPVVGPEALMAPLALAG